MNNRSEENTETFITDDGRKIGSSIMEIKNISLSFGGVFINVMGFQMSHGPLNMEMRNFLVKPYFGVQNRLQIYKLIEYYISIF